MRIFIIGGTRFVGYHIVRAFLKENHDVTVFHRGKHPLDMQGNVRVILGDRDDREALVNALGKQSYHVVIDTICYEETQAKMDIEVFLDRCEHFFFISTASVYLLHQGILPPYREEDIFLEPPDFVSQQEKYVYGFEKRKADLAFLQSYQEKNFPVTVIRAPIIVGPRDYTGRLYSYYHRIQEEYPILLPDGGHNAWGFVWVEDIAQFIVKYSLDKRVIGKAYNVSQRELVRLRDVVTALGQLIGIKPHILDIPMAFLLRHPMGTTFSPLYYPDHVYLDTTRASEIGFEPTSFWSWMTRWVQNARSNPQKDPYASTLEEEKRLAEDYYQILHRRNR